MALQRPNDELANQVIHALLGKGMIRENHVDDVRKALNTGKTRPEDWNLLAENMIMEEMGNDSQDSPKDIDT